MARRLGIGEYRGLRTPRHTFVRSLQGPWLLYDNETDPYQKHNLVKEASARPLLARFERMLDAKLKQAGDEFLPGASYVEKARAAHYREVTAPIGDITSPWGDWEATLKR